MRHRDYDRHTAESKAVLEHIREWGPQAFQREVIYRLELVDAVLSSLDRDLAAAQRIGAQAASEGDGRRARRYQLVSHLVHSRQEKFRNLRSLLLEHVDHEQAGAA